MFHNLVIRKCDVNDEAAYVKLNLDFMNEVMTLNPYWASLKVPTEEELKTAFQEVLKAPEEILIFVCEVDNKVVGYANNWKAYSIWSRGRTLIVDDLYVAEPFRKHGIGEKMMGYLINFAKENGFKRVQLHAELDNDKAHGLYRKMGFNEEEMLFFMKSLDGLG